MDACKFYRSLWAYVIWKSLKPAFRVSALSAYRFFKNRRSHFSWCNQWRCILPHGDHILTAEESSSVCFVFTTTRQAVEIVCLLIWWPALIFSLAGVALQPRACLSSLSEIHTLGDPTIKSKAKKRLLWITMIQLLTGLQLISAQKWD